MKLAAAVILLSLNLTQARELDIQKVVSAMKPFSGKHHAGVDTTTLKGKAMCGYQGWFAAEGDGSDRGWTHFGGRKGLKPGHCTIDFWPDMREMSKDEKFATSFKNKDGSTAYLFSPYHPKTVLRHFKWMKESGIDGIFLQRFATSTKSAKSLNHRNVVTANVQAGANQYGRTWAMMYDLSGLKKGEIEKFLIEDWKRLVDRMKITEDKSYLHHNGKPVVAVWGIGFKDGRDYTLDECKKLVNFLKSDKKYGGNTLMLGVPTGWRTLSRDAINDKKLHEIILKADIVSPWTVGRYSSPKQAEKHAEQWVKPDVAWTTKNKLDYLPVAYPGFSWHNLRKSQGINKKLDQIPRLKGEFLWSQASAFKRAGAQMLYVAMFDEVDEGTAIFKCSNNPPVGASPFLTYDGLPTDHYLWLTGKIGELMRNKLPATHELPAPRTFTAPQQ